VNSKQLEIFVKVAEAGSLSRAADTLGRAQPLLSRQVRELEKQLGASLFRRTGRGLVLTEAGRRLYKRAEIVLNELREAEQEVMSMGRAEVTHATIAMPTTMGRLLIKRLVDAIYAEYPGIRLRIREATSGPILEWVARRQVDLAILYDTVPTTRLPTELLCEETMYLVCRAAESRLPSTINYSLLKDIPLILPGPSQSLRILNEMVAAEVGIRLNIAIEADTFTAIRELMDAGYGYSILPLSAIQPEVASGFYQVSRLENPRVTRQVLVTTCRDHIRPNALKELVRLMKKAVAEAVEPQPPIGSTQKPPIRSKVRSRAERNELLTIQTSPTASGNEVAATHFETERR
jgi:LysR family nitrogen assimilation transcriptional regulator